jgi:hypothetical protein
VNTVYRTPIANGLDAFAAAKFDSAVFDMLTTDGNGGLVLLPTDPTAGEVYKGPPLRRVTISVIRNEFGHNAIMAFFIYIGGKIVSFFLVSPEKIKKDGALQRIAENTMQFVLDHSAMGTVNTAGNLVKSMTDALADFNDIIKGHKFDGEKGTYALHEVDDKLVEQLKAAIAKEDNKDRSHHEKALRCVISVIQLREQVEALKASRHEVIAAAAKKQQNMLTEAAKKVANVPQDGLDVKALTWDNLTGDTIPNAIESYKQAQNLEEKDGKLQVKGEGGKYSSLTAEHRTAMKAFAKLEHLHNQAKSLKIIAEPANKDKAIGARIKALEQQVAELKEKFPANTDPNVAGGMVKSDLDDLEKAIKGGKPSQIQREMGAFGKKLHNALPTDKDGKLTKQVGGLKKGDALNETNSGIFESAEKIQKEARSTSDVTSRLKKASGGVHHLTDAEFKALNARFSKIQDEFKTTPPEVKPESPTVQ